MNIAADLLARGEDDAVALLVGGVRITYRDLREQATHAAAMLAARGLGVQARVAIWSENAPSFVSAYLGTILAASWPCRCKQT